MSQVHEEVRYNALSRRHPGLIRLKLLLPSLRDVPSKLVERLPLPIHLNIPECGKDSPQDGDMTLPDVSAALLDTRQSITMGIELVLRVSNRLSRQSKASRAGKPEVGR